MSYSFCFGPSGSGKSRLLRRMIIERAQESLRSRGEDRTKYIVVVPEQYSMQTQRELVQEHPSHVLVNIDVLSFGRLAHRVFEETGADRRAVLGETGKSLLLRRVASRCAQDLQILHRGIHSPGMINEVKSILSEFMQYGISEKEIGEMADYAGRHGRNALQARLQDLQKLYVEFAAARKDSYVTSEETLDLLAAAIPEAESLAGSVIIFDGFTGFTTVQYRVILALIRRAKEVIFSFTASRDQGPDLMLTAAGGPAGQEGDLFYLTRKTVSDLLRLAGREHLPRGRDICLPADGLPRFSNSRVLGHLEANLFRHPAVPFPESRSGETAESLRMFSASTPQEEVRRIFGKIRRAIARTGCAYRDFAIVTADLETYGDLFAQEAERSRIPVYIDRTSGVFHNVLIEGIRSVLQISAESFSYPSVFRYLRSGLSRLTPEEVDQLENYCLANGIRGRKKWSAPFDASCEEARIRFLQEIEPVTGLSPRERDGEPEQDGGNGAKPRRARNAADRTRELHAFLVGCGAQAKMDDLSRDFGEEEDVVREKQYSQIYRAVIDLLDQIYDLTGEERMSARDYLELLEAGFGQIRLGTLPQRVDRILVGDIERTRLTQIRHLFFAGVNEGNIPRSAAKGGLLSDMDREFLEAGGVVLAPAPRQQIFIQRLYLYMNMTKPSETLTVSFARTSQEGKSLRPSYLISQLKELFPALTVENPELSPAQEQINGREDGILLLADSLRTFAEGSAGNDPGFRKQFSLLYGFYTSREVSADPHVRNAVRRLREAALFRYRPQSLQRENARRLYGNDVTGGISRMETAARCLLQQHLRYGLRLRERDLYEIAPVDAGNVLHAALQLFDAHLHAEGLSWREAAQEETLRLAKQALRETTAVYRNLLFYQSARDENLLGRYEQRLLRTIETLQYQIRQGDFTPAASELGFGTPDGQMPSIRFELGEGRKLVLVGRIDRVDLCVRDGRAYVRIMDYKSGRRDLDADMIRRGLQLQLISYMQSIRQADPGFLRALSGQAEEIMETVPSAMLYYRMQDPVIDLDPEKIPEESTPEAEAAEIRKKLRPTGLVYEDDESILHLDRVFSRNSDVIPVTRAVKGGYTSASRLISPEDYTELSADAQEVLCRLAKSILDGEITASPAVLQQGRSACQFCPFRDACGYDPRIPGYEMRYK